ncbi:hypothetical protein DFH27DRAFT_529442 [Peziza echinospora]|nr:hypothetical protein DFH27DRAFT_529442 [Peziza echinospora]
MSLAVATQLLWPQPQTAIRPLLLPTAAPLPQTSNLSLHHHPLPPPTKGEPSSGGWAHYIRHLRGAGPKGAGQPRRGGGARGVMQMMRQLQEGQRDDRARLARLEHGANEDRRANEGRLAGIQDDIDDIENQRNDDRRASEGRFQSIENDQRAYEGRLTGIEDDIDDIGNQRNEDRRANEGHQRDWMWNCREGLEGGAIRPNLGHHNTAIKTKCL